MMTAPNKDLIGTSAVHWLGRGFVVSLLLMGMANSISFFYRSAHPMLSLVGVKHGYEALGFPLMIWERGEAYGGNYVNYQTLGVNAGTGVILGFLFGMLLAWRRHWLNEWVREIEEETGDAGGKIQWTVANVLLATTLVAGAASLGRRYLGQPELLQAIFLFGPAFLIALAYVPRRASWRHRLIIVVPCTIALIVAAVSSGMQQGLDTDRVLLGIFVFWTPQTTLAAIAILSVPLLARVIRQRKQLTAVNPIQH